MSNNTRIQLRFISIPFIDEIADELWKWVGQQIKIATNSKTVFYNLLRQELT
jgi:hypothetical protein